MGGAFLPPGAILEPGGRLIHPCRPRMRVYFSKFLHRLREIHDAPHAVAGGVAIGLFWGFTPLTGLKTLLSLGLAWWLRCSRISAVIAVSLHDILLPIWPVILRWEYEIGYWLLSSPHRWPAPIKISHVHFNHLLDRKTIWVVWETFVGSLIIGLPIAALSYFLVLRFLQRYETKHHTHLTPPP
jgi:uncharacterized protein (DUF2062 family)